MVQDIVLSQGVKDEFRANGAVRIPSVVEQSWIELLKTTVEEEIENSGSGGHYASAESRTFFSSIRPWRWRDAFKRFVFESSVANIAAQLLDSPNVQLFSDQLFVKEPGAVEKTPWHQDLPYWPVRGQQVCSVWLALDEVDLASGGLEYVKGSHASGVWYRPQRFTSTEDMGESRESFDELPNFDARPPGVEFLSWTLQPGDCVVHHGRTVHGGGGNQSSDRRRRGYSTRWLGEDVVYNAAPGRIALEECSGLSDGAKLPPAEFPVLSFPSVRLDHRPEL